MIDIQILPKKAQNELLDYYHSLLQRYAPKKEKGCKKAAKKRQVNSFFDQFSIEMKNFNFSRDNT